MDITAQFKQGCNDGWTLFWSPFSGLVRMAEGIIRSAIKTQYAPIAQ